MTVACLIVNNEGAVIAGRPLPHPADRHPEN
jgi:hypothetical protein